MVSRRALLGAIGSSAAGVALAGWTGLPRSAVAASGSAVDWSLLRSQVSGGVVLPGEPEFGVAKRGFNPLFDGRVPAAVARCAKPEDVQACVRAAASRVPLAARSGGHSYGGYSVPDGGLVVDVGPMSTVDVRSDGTVKIGAGARLGGVYEALAGAGRCLPAGSCPTVGIAGLTLGGGIGVLARKFGLTCDRLVSADIVTADAELRTASLETEPELFWALRGGGGGNFGIVTSLTFATVSAPAVTVFSLRFPPGSASAVLPGWQSWISGAADELWSNLTLSGGAVPDCRVSGCFVGPERTLVPLLDDLVRRSGVAPIRRLVQGKRYLDAMRYFAGSEDRQSFVASSRVLGRPVQDPARMVDLLTGRDGVQVIVDALGGQVSTVDSAATAFPHRQAFAIAQVYSSATPQNHQAVKGTIAEVVAGLDELGAGGGYVNYIDPALPDWANAYYGRNLSRLREVANAYDPDQVFGFAQSVAA